MEKTQFVARAAPRLADAATVAWFIRRSVAVQLLPEQIAAATGDGKAIFENHDPTVDRDALRVIAGDSAAEHKRGCIGQLVVSTWHPAFQTDNSLIRRGDGGFDCLISGKKIDVKYRSRFEYELMVRTTEVTSDYYIMVTPAPKPSPVGLYYIRGYCTAALLKSKKPMSAYNEALYRKQGYVNYEVCPRELSPMTELLSLLGLSPR